jgi:sucrose-phosphate synthase
VDIVANCGNGILVEASDPQDIARALTSILIEQHKWTDFSNSGINGVRTCYSWQAHSQQTLQQLAAIIPGINSLAPESGQEGEPLPGPSFGRRLTNVRYLMITDIDNTLVGDESSMRELFGFLQDRQEEIAWGVATGRSLELTLEAMTEYDFPMPDILICSVGTEIYYGPNLRYDKGWQQHISYQWKAEDIKAALADFDFLVFQEAEGQRSHKISYYLDDRKNNRYEMVRERLKERKLRCQTIYSHGQFLDILPLRASKGRAIEYLRYKFDFSPRRVMVAGDSGNDEDMIAGASRGLVVGNHSVELENLRNRPNIYFSQAKYAAGIIDGLKHYGIY